jgi:hypothetical protein
MRLTKNLAHSVGTVLAGVALATIGTAALVAPAGAADAAPERSSAGASWQGVWRYEGNYPTELKCHNAGDAYVAQGASTYFCNARFEGTWDLYLLD